MLDIFTAARPLLQILKSDESKSQSYEVHLGSIVSPFASWLNASEEADIDDVEYSIENRIQELEHLLSPPADTQSSPAAFTNTESDSSSPTETR